MLESYHYIASPYTHPDSTVRAARYEQALTFLAWALNNGIWSYCPIVQCHALCVKHKMPYEFNFWRDYNKVMLTAAAHVIVLQLDGWQQSKGVGGEIEFAKGLDKPISYMVPR